MSSAPGFKVVIAEDPVSRLTRAQLMQSSLLVGWSYGRAKQIYSDNEKNLSPRLHLVSAAEAGALVCFLHKSSLACENKNAASESSSSSQPYSGLYGLPFYLNMLSGIYLILVNYKVSHGAFTVYEELRTFIANSRSDGPK